MKKLFLMGLMIGCMCAFVCNADDLNAWLNASNKASKAIAAEDWSSAIYWYNQCIEHDDLDVNKASDYVSLSMLYWNKNQKPNAITSLQRAIYLMDNGQNLGHNCSAAAKVFLERMKNGRLPRKFTPRDMQHADGILCFIMEAPWAVNERKTNASIRRAETLGALFDSMRAAEARKASRW